METNPYDSKLSTDGMAQVDSERPAVRRSVSCNSLARSVIRLAAIPAWIGAVFFFTLGMVATVKSHHTPQSELAFASGTSTLLFLVLQRFGSNSLRFAALLTVVGGLSLLAVASEHAFRETELQLLAPDCGLAAMPHFVFSVFWLSTYLCVPAILLVRLLDRADGSAQQNRQHSF